MKRQTWFFLCTFFLDVGHCYENIAIKKPAYQQTPFIPGNETFAASNAVDGRRTNLKWNGGQCAVAATGQTATWWVNLTSIHSIHHITIYFLTNDENFDSSTYLARSFLGFSVYVSNTTNRLQGTLCFKDTNFTGSTIPAVFNTTCTLHGQYVIYYNERLKHVKYPKGYSEFAESDLCEVEVYGCPTIGFYGSNCSIPCPDVNCRYCHIDTGTCQGCKPGYEGHRCELKCPRGYFGEECAGKCSNNCYSCNNINGLCDSGCHPGWRGDYCHEVCLHGFFGQDCSEQCHQECIGCNHVNGSCVSGCKQGWKGDRCREACNEGLYGFNCSEKCGHCQDIKQCFHLDGMCTTGCDAGFQGKLCKTHCKEGSYGYKCNETCGNCRNNGFCFHINGTCLTGCSAGFTGEVCKMHCKEGSYGVDCGDKCGHCRDVNQCLHNNGTCLTGCSAGYQGTLCVKPCSYGFFGLDCAEKCIDTCAGCNNINGLCDYGCIPGWTGYFCNTVCPVGFFGQECAYICNNTCKGCNNTNGLCDSGCNPGWKGNYCNEGLCSRCRKNVTQEMKWCECCKDASSAQICQITSDDTPEATSQQSRNLQTRTENYAEQCHSETENSAEQCHSETLSQHNNLPTIIVLLGSIIAVAVLLITILFWRTRRKTLKLRTTTNTDDYEAETSIQHLGQNRMQNLSTYSQKSNLEESRNLPSSLNMKCTHGKTSKKASNSNGLNDRNTYVDEKVHAGNQVDDVFQIKEHCTIEIDVTELGKVIEGNMKNDDSGFKKEYASLLYGDQYPCNIGKHPGNITKNRFKTILPYDHSRITLERKCSDYINANYIDGIGQENDYIATQGPKKNTVNDFWVMVWQEKVAQIAMLTNLVEETKTKCIQYWPDLEASMDCDILTLRTTEERRYAYYVIRRLNIKHRQKHENRTVTHYHFTAWPDHGVPDPICLLLFHNHVERTTRTSYGGPTIVHCSAGIGRTGTYIAVDALYKESQRNNKINIAEYVKDMREKRMNMVQTCKQYKTIYLTLHEMLKAQIPIQNTMEFLQKLEAAKIDLPANDSLIRKDVQRLLTLQPQYTEADYELASDYRDMSSSVLPLDKYVLFLTSTVSKRGNDINAISVPSFTNRDKFIITHYQNPADAVDFLRLITDHESEVVVCMDPLSSVESAEQWLPTITKAKSLIPFKIELQEEHKTEIRCRKIRISNKGIEDKECLVEFVEPLYNFNLKESQTASQILGLVSLVEKIETDNPITVVSRDGAALCGVFCVVYNLIQQLTMDEEIDVFSAVRLLQTRRPELCNSLEEYELIHEALYRFIKSRKEEHIYYNQ